MSHRMNVLSKDRWFLKEIFACLFIHLFIYLAALGLSRGTRDLRCCMRDLHRGMWNLFSCGMWDLFYFSVVVAHGIFVAACRIFSCGMGTLSCGMHVASSSLIRDQTPHALGAWSLNPWTTREAPKHCF